jgi:hypothetical protein
MYIIGMHIKFKCYYKINCFISKHWLAILT